MDAETLESIFYIVGSIGLLVMCLYMYDVIVDSLKTIAKSKERIAKAQEQIAEAYEDIAKSFSEKSKK